MIVKGFKVFTEEDAAAEDADEIFERSYALREVTIECTAWELGNLVRFLEKARDDYAGYDGYGHEHLRDWDHGWTEDESDVIVVFNVDRA